MKKGFMFMLIILSVFLLSGCSYFKEKKPSPEKTTIETSNKIMEALQQNDKQSLKELFCPYMKENYLQLDEEIDKLYEFIDGEIVSYEEPRPSPLGGATKEYEGWTEQYVVPRIKKIKTSSNKEYMITYKYHLIYKERPTYEGISVIIIKNESESDDTSIVDYKIKFNEMWE